MKEVWKDVKGFEGLYLVSNLGNVKGVDRKCGNRHNEIPGKVLTKQERYGYLLVALSKNGKFRYYRIHRIVAEAFIDNPNEKPHINHIDGNKRNNTVENLEWVTQQENNLHAFKTGLSNMDGAQKYNTEKRTPIIATSINTGEEFYFKSMCDAQRALHTKVINRVIRGERTQSQGYTFRYA